jgi:hypothetical protein
VPRPRLVIWAALVVLAVLPSAASALTVKLDNRSEHRSDRVWVMLSGGSSADGKLADGVPTRLDRIANRSFRIDGISAGRIYVSFGRPVAPNEPMDSPTRYDKVELTYPGVANLTAVDFFAIPLRLQTLDRDGHVLGRLGYSVDTTTVKRALLAIPGADRALIKTRIGTMARILSPQLSPSSYPLFGRYVSSLAGQSVVVRGAYYGTPYQTFVYRGTFADSGDVTLRGRIAGPSGTAPGYDLSVDGATLDSAIYTANGEYRWGGGVHHVADNDVYAVIYRDLISGYAWGYWGGRYGNDTAKWQGKPPFEAARVSPSPYATYNRYAAAIYRYSNAYGFAFSDTGPKKVVVGLDDAKTLRIVIPPDQARG